MNHFAVIIAAAGSGTRFQSGQQKKTYAMLDGKPVWRHSVGRFAERDDVEQVLIVVSPEDHAWFVETYGNLLAAFRADVVAGGAERFDSVENALSKVRAGIDFVAVHDGARPCISNALLERVFSTARLKGNAVPAVAVSSTIKRSANGEVVDATVDRSELFLSQTPQVFRVQELRSAFSRRGEFQPTDEAQLMEMLGETVHLAEGCPLNLKITTQQDVDFAEAALVSLHRSSAKPIHFDGPIDDSTLR